LVAAASTTVTPRRPPATAGKFYLVHRGVLPLLLRLISAFFLLGWAVVESSINAVAELELEVAKYKQMQRMVIVDAL